jgi:hypothetical protein
MDHDERRGSSNLGWLPSLCGVQAAAHEGEDLAACRAGGWDQAGRAEEAVDGLRVAGQTGVGAVRAEPFDVSASLVGYGVQLAGDGQRRWQIGTFRS